MTHTLQTGITAETLPGPVRIDLDGCLTEDTVKDLIPLLRRGASFEGCPDLVIDLRRVDHIEPRALDVLDALTTRHNALATQPKMSVELASRGVDSTASSPPRCGAVVATADAEADPRSSVTAPAAPSIVADLMVPIGSAIGITQSLRDAADRVSRGQEALAVLGLNDTPIGYITAEDLLAAAQADPTRWQRKRCASLVQMCESPLQRDFPIESVIKKYREEGMQSMLIVDAGAPVGLLRPEAVRQWCESFSPLPLDDLMYKPALHLAEPPELVAE